MNAGAPSDIARAIDQPVALVDADPAWPAMFESERSRILHAMPGTFVAIEHIGSTAVAGLRAKPLIDMLAGVRSLDAMFALNDTIERVGYTTSPALNASLTTRQWFMRQSGGVRKYHLHAVVYGDDDWTIRLRFRDRLRADPVLRARYLALKEDLAVRFAGNREAYTQGKSDFIRAASDVVP